jgi:hypothetical protein
VTGFERGLRPERRLVDDLELVDVVGSLHDAGLALARAAAATPQARAEHVVHQRRLAGAGHARHRGEGPEREAHVERLQVVERGALHVQEQPVAAPPARRDRDAQVAAQVLRRQAARLVLERLGRPLVDDLAALLARSGTEVDHVVGGLDERGVVLDDDDRVPLVAQRLQDPDQPVRVARMEAYRRLVQHEERAHETGAERGGQRDALRLAARERRRGAVEPEVLESHVLEEAEPTIDLLEHAARDGLLGALELESVRKRRTAPTGIAETSRIDWPASRTRSASGRRRAPPQAGHSW